MNYNDLVLLLKKWDKWSDGLYQSHRQCHYECPMGPLCLGAYHQAASCWVILILGHATGIINLKKGPPKNAVCKRDSDEGF